MKNKMLCVLAFLPVLTVGCVQLPSTTNVLPLPVPGAKATVEGTPPPSQPVVLDRYGAWAYTRAQEEETAREEVRQENKTSQPNQQRTENIEIILDSPEALAAYANIEMARSMGQTNVALANALQNCSTGKKKVRVVTPMPKSGFAEGAEAIGAAGRKLLDAPVVNATGTLLAAGEMLARGKDDTPDQQVKTKGDVIIGGGKIDKPSTEFVEVIQPEAAL